jgi:hypothetical protein
VKALQLQAEEAKKSETLVAAMSQVLTTATGQKTEDTSVTVEEVGSAVVELAAEKVALAKAVAEQRAEIDELKLTAAKAEVAELKRAGRVLPHQEETMVRLAVEDRKTFDALVPANAIVSLSEEGVTTHDAPPKDEQITAETEQAIARYEQLALSHATGKGNKK